jgi:NadR type nicotinamide-nucleotide adenylyltransferase
MTLRRIVVTGGECTGKTTLARELAARWRTAWAAEAAREVALESRAALGPEDVPVIARTHVRLAEAACRSAAEAGRPLVVFDQDLVSTVVYARHYYGSCPAWSERLATERLAGLYLLCHPDLPWVADGVRDRQEARAEIHALFAEALDRAGARVAHVTGAGPERADAAVKAVEELLAARIPVEG